MRGEIVSCGGACNSTADDHDILRALRHGDPCYLIGEYDENEESEKDTDE